VTVTAVLPDVAATDAVEGETDMVCSMPAWSISTVAVTAGLKTLRKVTTAERDEDDVLATAVSGCM
jgi:hypothetical protein